MNETRKYIFEDKVFILKDVKRIATLFWNEKQVNDKIKLTVECSDNTQYESESLNIFDEEGITSTKIVTKITMNLYNYESDKYISIDLDAKYYKRGNLVVSGSDRDWVTARFNQVKELIDNVKNHDNWFINNQKIIFHLSSIIIGYVVLKGWIGILGLIISPIENPTEPLQKFREFSSENNWFPFIIYLLASWGAGLTVSSPLRDWVLKLFPKIEFDFGPEHLKLHKLRRNRIYTFLLVVVVPLFLGIIYDVIKLAI